MISQVFLRPGRCLLGAGVIAACLMTPTARAEEHHHHRDQADAAGAAPSHHHHDEVAPEGFPEPPAGTRWATDEPLRRGMTRIRAAVTLVLADQARGALKVEQAEALQRTLNTEFATMAAKCELAPDADAALHVIIVRLMEAAAHLVEDPQEAAAAGLLRKALNHYGIAFNHPDWAPLAEPGQR